MQEFVIGCICVSGSNGKPHRIDKDTAWITAYTGSRIAYMCQRRVMNFAINKERLTRFGLLGLMAIDYKKPVKVISEDEKFMKQIEKWAVEE